MNGKHSRRAIPTSQRKILMPSLTPELKKAVEQAGDDRVTLTDPETKREYVLVPLDEYQKLAAMNYDDSPWTDEEMDALAEEARQSLDGPTTGS
jgi:hypothetical protein